MSDNLTLTQHQFEFKFASGGDVGAFSGYGSVFNTLDSHGDIIKPGAFSKTLAQHKAAGSMPLMFLNHAGLPFGTTSALDLVPIGIWTKMAEDSNGLAVSGRLIGLDTERGRIIYNGMLEGALTGLSIGYKTVRTSKGNKPSDPRFIHEAKLYEISVVSMPSHEQAIVDSIKTHGTATAHARVMQALENLKRTLS